MFFNKDVGPTLRWSKQSGKGGIMHDISLCFIPESLRYHKHDLHSPSVHLPNWTFMVILFPLVFGFVNMFLSSLSFTSQQHRMGRRRLLLNYTTIYLFRDES